MAYSYIRQPFFRLIATVVIAGSILPLAWGQSQSINGSIQGRVSDPAAAPVPDAQVTVKNDSAGLTRTQSTNTDGYYAIPNLPLGSYTVTIQKTGFQAERHTGV